MHIGELPARESDSILEDQKANEQHSADKNLPVSARINQLCFSCVVHCRPGVQPSSYGLDDGLHDVYDPSTPTSDAPADALSDHSLQCKHAYRDALSHCHV